MAKSKANKSAAAAEAAAAPSGYTVLARRYRPRQLDELIGQEHVARALANALASGRVAHAYLFTGARGTGKTSCARILAKCLNCERGPTPTPCDACDICRSIATGDDVDVMEIDGASNNKVDEVRELRQNVGFRPARARYKIYIIDEVHMLSTGAFNALLKTLEEPPGHVKFILATTEIQKIPVTIRSRCQRFDFAFVKPTKIVEQLKKIVQLEGLEADDEALQIIARRAAGSMRDSQSLLDQLLAFAEGRLTAAQVHEVLGSAGDERVAELAELILRRDAAAAVHQLQQFADAGVQLGEMIDQLIEHWRGLMMVLAAGPDYPDLPGTQRYQETLKNQAAATNLDTVLAGLDVLTSAKLRSKGSLHAATLLEMAVVRLARLDELVAVTELLAGEAPPVVKSPAAAGDSSKKNFGPEPQAPVPESVGRVNLSDPAAVREFLGDRLGPLKAAALSRAQIAANFEPNRLDIVFTGGYYSAYESCSDELTARQIESAMRDLTGQAWSIAVSLSETGEAVAANRGNGKPAREDLLNKPLFRRLVSCLGAELVKLDDDFQPVPSQAVDLPEAET